MAILKINTRFALSLAFKLHANYQIFGIHEYRMQCEYIHLAAHTYIFIMLVCLLS